MDLTSKQRAQLRSLANNIDTILIEGKDGIGDNLVKRRRRRWPPSPGARWSR